MAKEYLQTKESLSMEMLVSVLLFAVGLVLLIKGGDWFVDGASGIATRSTWLKVGY